MTSPIGQAWCTRSDPLVRGLNIAAFQFRQLAFLQSPAAVLCAYEITCRQGSSHAEWLRGHKTNSQEGVIARPGPCLPLIGLHFMLCSQRGGWGKGCQAHGGATLLLARLQQCAPVAFPASHRQAELPELLAASGNSNPVGH